MGVGAFWNGLRHIKRNSQIRDTLFSATWCLLSQHMASLASNSSEMDPKKSYERFLGVVDRFGRYEDFTFEIDTAG